MESNLKEEESSVDRTFNEVKSKQVDRIRETNVKNSENGKELMADTIKNEIVSNVVEKISDNTLVHMYNRTQNIYYNLNDVQGIQNSNIDLEDESFENVKDGKKDFERNLGLKGIEDNNKGFKGM